ncbi:MAG: hypothetical protein ISR56_10915 [Bacteroidales bacterium]|nr:hypothetical protein [Bacteroidales bacterium]
MFDIRKNLSNAFGWRTNRKIIVIESDDWGSLRTHSKGAYKKMIEEGLELDRSNFTKFDALESNRDLENLFEVLAKHKDASGRHPVFTPMCVVANPHFEKIESSDFSEYHFESFLETCKKYPAHDKVGDLWQTGVNKRLFVPQLHGREHLNVAKWMRALKAGNEGLRISFAHQSFGASWFKGQKLPEYLAAFDPETQEDIPAYETIIRDASRMFQDICGYQPKHFIASNSPEPQSLEKTLKEIGIEYLTRYKIQRYPLGNGKYTQQFNWLGKRNKLGQIYLTRNSGFEPSDNPNKDWVNDCLREINNAFQWKKPAIISSHRVNYIGFIEKNNSSNGLNKLNTLLSSIVREWPDVEFLTSTELGQEIIYK